MNEYRQGLQAGYYVCMPILAEFAPDTCYIGIVMAVDPRGVRLALIRPSTGQADGWDVFVPWNAMGVTLVGTPEHFLERFPEAANRWKTKMVNKRSKTPSFGDQLTVLNGTLSGFTEPLSEAERQVVEEYRTLQRQEYERVSKATSQYRGGDYAETNPAIQ